MSELRSWHPRVLEDASAELRALVTAITAELDHLTDHLDHRLAAVWSGAAATAAHTEGAAQRSSLRSAAGALAVCALVLSAASDALTEAQRALARADDVVRAGGLSLHEDGAVSLPESTTGSGEYGPGRVDLLELAARAGALARQALAEAVEADTDAARDLDRAAELAERADRLGLDPAEGMSGTAHGTALRTRLEDELLADVVLLTPPPDVARSPTQAAAWWQALSAEQRGLQIRHNPHLIGGLEGLPVAARDQANRLVLGTELALARAARPPLVAKTYLLESVQRQLRGWPTRELMLLDVTGSGRAAIAIGDIDSADHVVVIVPGTEQDITHDMGRIVASADQLNGQMRTYSQRLGLGTTATLAWLGYATPTLTGATSDRSAIIGAEQLRASLEGLAAARRAAVTAGVAPQMQLTLIGHSYGSLTAGLALHEPSPVDDFVILGSPGVDADTVAVLPGVPAKHTFVGAAMGDLVAHLGYYGNDPSSRSFGASDFQTDGGSGVDGMQLSPSYGHSQYFNRRSESLANISWIALGRPDLVSYSPWNERSSPASGSW